MKKLVVLIVVAAALAGVWYLRPEGGPSSGAESVRFRTGKVERGEVVEGVQASGTVQPVLLVQVGTQISGVIEKLSADFNSRVKAGQTIAMLDTRRLAAQVASDEASVARATADLDRLRAALDQSRSESDRVRAAGAQAAADVQRQQALLTQAERELGRQRTLADRGLVTASDLDAAVASKGSLEAQLASSVAAVKLNEAQLASALASVRQSEAQVAVGEAAIRQSEAQLRSDRVNLEYATIVSPIDGVVVSRNVDVGQTVAASLSAPTLFVIANDLTKVQVETSVPEADIGRLHEGQNAHFTVDAHPDRSFDGKVSQVRLASTTVQNVVTYTVIVDAENPEGLLLPGMTANVTFEIQRSAKDALSVPASALRLQVTPDLLEAAPETEKPSEPSAGGRPAHGSGATPGEEAAPGAGGGSGRRQKGGAHRPRTVVYVQTGANLLRAVPVRAGIGDGIRTAIEPIDAAALPEGTEVVTAILRDEAPAATNPFAPPRFGGATRRTGGR